MTSVTYNFLHLHHHPPAWSGQPHLWWFSLDVVGMCVRHSTGDLMQRTIYIRTTNHQQHEQIQCDPLSSSCNLWLPFLRLGINHISTGICIVASTSRNSPFPLKKKKREREREKYEGKKWKKKEKRNPIRCLYRHLHSCCVKKSFIVRFFSVPILRNESQKQFQLTKSTICSVNEMLPRMVVLHNRLNYFLILGTVNNNPLGYHLSIIGC